MQGSPPEADQLICALRTTALVDVAWCQQVLDLIGKKRHQDEEATLGPPEGDARSGDWRDSITGFSIVMTSAAPCMTDYQDRMPAVLEESHFEH